MNSSQTTHEIAKGVLYAGLIGDPVAHSLSPLLHRRAAAELGLSLDYTTRRVCRGEAAAAIEEARAAGFVGLNVTSPLKLEVAGLLDELSADARDCGAVNTILFRDGRTFGFNTDVKGFASSLAEAAGFDAQGCRALILGAGGAARAAALALLRSDAKHVAVGARREDAFADFPDLSAHGLHLRQTQLGSPKAEELLKRADLVVNATGAGTSRIDESPLEGLPPYKPGALALELAYWPRVTRFTAQARNMGLSTMNGLPMLAYQAALSLAIWSGQEVPGARMLSYLHEAGYGD